MIKIRSQEVLEAYYEAYANTYKVLPTTIGSNSVCNSIQINSIEYMKLSDISLSESKTKNGKDFKNPARPGTIDENHTSKLADTFKRDGYNESYGMLLVDENDKLLNGYHRYHAFESLNVEKIPVIKVTVLDDDTLTALLLNLNNEITPLAKQESPESLIAIIRMRIDEKYSEVEDYGLIKLELLKYYVNTFNNVKKSEIVKLIEKALELKGFKNTFKALPTAKKLNNDNELIEEFRTTFDISDDVEITFVSFGNEHYTTRAINSANKLYIEENRKTIFVHFIDEQEKVISSTHEEAVNKEFKPLEEMIVNNLISTSGTTLPYLLGGYTVNRDDDIEDTFIQRDVKDQIKVSFRRA